MANVFETEVQQGARHLGLGHWKLNVGPGAGRMIRRFTHTAPYDCFLLHAGRHVALELKSQELHGSFSWDRVKEHQLAGLREAARHGCPAYLLVNMRRKKAGAKTVTDNQAWALSIADWEPLLQSLPPGPGGKPRKSVPRSVFDESQLFRPLPRTHVVSAADGKKTLAWDLTVLLPA